MKKTLLVLVLFVAAVQAADGPDVERARHAYINAPWFSVHDQGREFVCIASDASQQVDRVVAWLVERAKDRCS